MEAVVFAGWAFSFLRSVLLKVDHTFQISAICER